MTLRVSIYYWCIWQYLYVKWYFYQNENNTDIFLEQTHSVPSSPSMVRLSLLFSLVLSLSSPLVAGDGVWTTDCRLLATQRLDPIGTELLGPAGFSKLGRSGSGSRVFDPHSHSGFLLFLGKRYRKMQKKRPRRISLYCRYKGFWGETDKVQSVQSGTLSREYIQAYFNWFFVCRSVSWIQWGRACPHSGGRLFVQQGLHLRGTAKQQVY